MVDLSFTSRAGAEGRPPDPRPTVPSWQARSWPRLGVPGHDAADRATSPFERSAVITGPVRRNEVRGRRNPATIWKCASTRMPSSSVGAAACDRRIRNRVTKLKRMAMKLIPFD